MKITNGIPVLIDESLSFSLKNLRTLGFFDNEGYKTAPINLYRRGTVQQSSNIWIAVSVQDGSSYIELDYSVDDKSINYNIELIQVASNLGKGKIWQMLCPVNNRICRKVYLYQDYFISRRAIEGSFYTHQILKKSFRNEYGEFGRLVKYERILKASQKPYFKTHYAGIETKKMAEVKRALAKINLMDYGFGRSGIKQD